MVSENGVGRINLVRILITFVISLLAVAGGVWAILVVGSPRSVRSREMDRVRASDLQDLRGAVEAYYCEHEELPESLNLLLLDDSLTDPVSQEQYEYRVLDSRRCEFVATFALAEDRGSHFGNHTAGRNSFTFVVCRSKDHYRPFRLVPEGECERDDANEKLDVASK